MNKPLLGQKIAVLVANGFSEKDLTLTQKAMMHTGANMRIVGMDHGLVNSWNGEGWGLNFASDQALSRALSADFDMLIVPGGQRSIEKLELTAHTRRFLSGFVETDKPVVLFEEALGLLLFAECADGLTVAGGDGLRDRAEGQGVAWSEAPYVISRNVMSGVSVEETREEFTAAVAEFLIHYGQDVDNVSGGMLEPVAA